MSYTDNERPPSVMMDSYTTYPTDNYKDHLDTSASRIVKESFDNLGDYSKGPFDFIKSSGEGMYDFGNLDGILKPKDRPAHQRDDAHLSRDEIKIGFDDYRCRIVISCSMQDMVRTAGFKAPSLPQDKVFEALSDLFKYSQAGIRLSFIREFFKELKSNVEDENSLASTIFSVFTEYSYVLFTSFTPSYATRPDGSLEPKKFAYIFQSFMHLFQYARQAEIRIGCSIVDTHLLKFFKEFIVDTSYAPFFSQLPELEQLSVAFCFIYWDKDSYLAKVLDLAPGIFCLTLLTESSESISIVQYAFKMKSYLCIKLILTILRESLGNLFVSAIESNDPEILKMFLEHGFNGKATIFKPDGEQIDALKYALDGGFSDSYHFFINN